MSQQQEVQVNDLEILNMELAFLYDQREKVEARILEKESRKRELEEEQAEFENPFWLDDGDDPFGGRLNKQVEAVKNVLETGTRAERYYMAVMPVFNNRLVVTMAEKMEDVDPAYLAAYGHEQTQHFFTKGWGGVLSRRGSGGYALDLIDDENGNPIPGYLIPWAGNHGPIVARKRFERFWAAPNRLEDVKEDAREMMDSVDFYYSLAVRTNTVAEFMADHPHYKIP
jgi:hypothetical protein